MFCSLFLVALLAATVCGEEQERVTTDPPSVIACLDRRSDSLYSSFYLFCGIQRRGVSFTYNPPPYADFMTFPYAINKIINPYSGYLNTPPRDDYDLQCFQSMQQLLCFQFFPMCFGGEKYIAPCYEKCVNVRAACESVINETLDISWPEDLNCERHFNYTDDNRICAEDAIPVPELPTNTPSPVPPSPPPCANRTSDPNYASYNATCGHLRGTDAQFTLNPPPYDSTLTFETAIAVQERYRGIASPPTDECNNILLTKCYYILEQLLCLSIFPFCAIGADDVIYYSPPCFDGCLEVRHVCEPMLPQLGITEWPQSLECSQFNYTDDENKMICAPAPTIELSCTTSTSPPHATSSESASMTITPSTTTAVAMTTSSVTTSTTIPTETPTSQPNYYCTDAANIACAKIRYSASKSAFKPSKHYKFAIKATLIEVVYLYTAMYGREIGYRVAIEQDFDLRCTGKQYNKSDIVIVHSDQPCVECLSQLQVDHTYLFMGTISHSRESYYSNGDHDEGWILEAIPGSGGCITSPWEGRYDQRLCSWLTECNTREC